MAFTIQSGGGSNIPQIKETSINFLPAGNTILTASVNQISTRIKAVPFQVFGDINTKGVVFQVANPSTATLHLALYKYDYDNDIWDIATEQLDINIAASGIINQNFTTPQNLKPALYCVAFRDNNSTGKILGLFKNRSKNKFSGNFTSMSAFYNMMRTNVISYSPTLPNQIVLPSSNFQELNYHEFFQITF